MKRGYYKKYIAISIERRKSFKRLSSHVRKNGGFQGDISFFVRLSHIMIVNCFSFRIK
ncbi:hypothetical protein BPUM_3493 [Bacillus pumilus SAFR-032]|uniref:Uncharacterized protein n=1 Tax=Bacillus pumilus (strain SAFR-032) TaxID=315750 RepID=A8FIS4_BACP2|nr:hypothetical protein BPUM_3493 [Bacillus pumilus SAFR-032]